MGSLTCPDISREEIVNACGIDDLHDGVNYTRTACVIAVSKARDMFEPFLHQVRPAVVADGRGACVHVQGPSRQWPQASSGGGLFPSMAKQGDRIAGTLPPTATPKPRGPLELPAL